MQKPRKITLDLLDELRLRANAARADGPVPSAEAIVRRADTGQLLLVQPNVLRGEWGFVSSRIGSDVEVVEALLSGLRQTLCLDPQDFAIEAYLGRAPIERRLHFFFAVTCARPDDVAVDVTELGFGQWVRVDELPSMLANVSAEKAALLHQIARQLP